MASADSRSKHWKHIWSIMFILPSLDFSSSTGCHSIIITFAKPSFVDLTAPDWHLMK